jgi:O-antigen/teichoic acid export membrane protein
LKKEELIFPIRLALIGIGGAQLFSFSTYALQALQKFWVWSGLNIGMNLLRLLVVLVIISWGILTTNNSLLIYITIPFLGFLVGIFFLPNFVKVKRELSVAKEFFHYNIWVAAATLIAAIGARADTFISTRLLSFSQVGIYSVATQLASIVPQVIFALGTVVAPKLAGMSNKEEAIKYLKKLQIFTLGLAVAGLIVGIPLSRIFIPIFYGGVYLDSIPPFIILLLAQAVFLISVPAHTSVYYYFGYPKLFVWISIGHLMIILGLGWFLISRFGFMGAAITVLIGTIFNFLVPAIWAIRKFRQ